MGIRRRAALVATMGIALMTTSALAAAPVSVTWSPAIALPGAVDSDPDVRLTMSSDGSRVAALWTQGSPAEIWGAGSADSGGTWSTPTRISAASIPLDSDSPQIAGSDDGLRVSALWYTTDSPNRIATATSTDGGVNWGTPVSRPIGTAGGNPQLASSASGAGLAAVWAYDAVSERIVQSSAYTGTSWSLPVNVSDPSESADEPDIAISSDGQGAAVVFAQSQGTEQRVFTRFSDTGGASWGAAVARSDTGANAGSPRVVMSADGQRVHVLWTRGDGVHQRVQIRSSGDGGASWGPVRTVSEAGQDASTADLAASADGQRVIAIWKRSDGATERIQTAVSSDSGASWSGPVTQSFEGFGADNPRVAMADDGRAVSAIWYRQTNGNPVIESVSSADGGTSWGQVSPLSDPAEPASDPDIGTSASGRSMIAMWGGSDGTDTRIWRSTGTLRTAPASPTSVSATAGDAQATATWTPSTDTGGSPITGYTATATPGGRSCTAITTSCTITGLSNGTSYTVTVTATNAIGTGPASAASNPVTPLAPVVPAPPPPPAPAPAPQPQPEPEPEDPATKVIAKAKDGKDKLRVTVKPDLGKKKQWEFIVKVKKDGDWKKLTTKKGKTKVYETEGADHRLTLDLDKGTYKAKSKAARGYAADTSEVVKLKK